MLVAPNLEPWAMFWWEDGFMSHHFPTVYRRLEKVHDGFNTTVKTLRGIIKSVWAIISANMRPLYRKTSTDIWLNTIRVGLEHQKDGFSNHQIQNYNYWTFWKIKFPCTLNKEVLWNWKISLYKVQINSQTLRLSECILLKQMLKI